MTRQLSSLFAIAALAALASLSACSPSGGSAASSPLDGGPGATPPPDGAPGLCCPASTGGCAFVGGYRADGDCSAPEVGEICDNMCEEKLVDDEHGCKTLVYKTPNVETTYAGTGSCDSPMFNGGGPDASTGGDADAGGDSD